VNQLRFFQFIAELDFADPARVIGPNRRSMTGRAFVRHASVPFECALERDLLVIPDFDSSVQPVGAHPSCAEATQECASSVIKWKVQLLGGRHSARRGPVRAIMAIAHKLLIAAFHMLRTGEAFRDLGESYLDQVTRKRSTTKLVQRLSSLEYDGMLVPKAA